MVPMMIIMVVVTMFCVALQQESGLKLQTRGINSYRGIVCCNRTTVMVVVPMMIIVVVVTMFCVALQQESGLKLQTRGNSIHTVVSSAATARLS